MRTSIQLLPACIRLPLAITSHLKIKDYIHQWYNQKLDIGRLKKNDYHKSGTKRHLSYGTPPGRT